MLGNRSSWYWQERARIAKEDDGVDVDSIFTDKTVEELQEMEYYQVSINRCTHPEMLYCAVYGLRQ